MRRITYWKDVSVADGVSFALIPLNTLDDDQPFYDRLVKHIKNAGCQYKIEEIVTTVVEKSCPPIF